MFRRPAHGVRRAAVLLTAALVVVTGSCGDDDGNADDGAPRAQATETPVSEGSSATGPAGTSTDTDGTGPTGASALEIDDELVREAQEYFAQQLQLIAPEAIGRPLDEFIAAVADACRAVTDPSLSTPDERAEAVADAFDTRDGVPSWRGAAIAVSTQYFFLGGCDVPDREAVVEALAPHITEGLGDR